MPIINIEQIARLQTGAKAPVFLYLLTSTG